MTTNEIRLRMARNHQFSSVYVCACTGKGAECEQQEADCYKSQNGEKHL